MSALRRRGAATQAVAREARVSNPDPDELTVTIDEFDGDELARHAWPVVGWPANATAAPARGDRCLVVMSETGRAWVVAAEWTGSMPDWQSLTPATGWTPADGASFPLGYAKAADGWVALRGLLRATARPSRGALFSGQLGRGFRPGSARSFPVMVGAGLIGRVSVSTDGTVAADVIPSAAASGEQWTLDGIGYWAEN